MKILCITDRQDRPETELFIRLSRSIGGFAVMSNPDGRYYRLLDEAGVRVIPLRIRGRFDREATAAIQAEAERGDYDIIHAFNSRALNCLLRACHHHRARLLAYRGVTTGVGYLKPESWHTYLSPRLDGVFCVSEAVRRALVSVRFMWMHFPAERARVIYKGHDPRWYDVPPVMPDAFGVPAGAPTLCCVSRNSARKGVTMLLDAFDRLPGDMNVHLLLVGGIDANVEVRRRIARCRFPDRIHLTGYRDDAIAIVRGSDVLVSASENEGFPRTVAEAMCIGTMVVATAVGGTVELVQDGESGLLVPAANTAALADALTRAVSDPAARARYVAAARERMEQCFHIDHTVAGVLSWYRELLGLKPS